MNKNYSPKQIAIYRAVIELFGEGADLNRLTVSEITGKAGIGKGTAYEYFSDKEEMIARALLYNIALYCEWIYQGLVKGKNLHDRVEYLLKQMEEQLTRTNCLIRLVHLMSDHSPLGKKIEELKNRRETDEMMPMDMLKQFIRNEFKGKKERSEEMTEYLVMSVFSKVICYGMLLNEGKYREERARQKRRELTCNGICREIEEA